MIIENPVQKVHSTEVTQQNSMGIISGSVIDNRVKSVLEGARVHIWNSMSRAAVSTDGKFTLEIPDYLNSDVVILEVRNKNYESKIVSYKIKNIPEFITIELDKKSKAQIHSSSRKRWRLFGWSF
jgi:hypothetical protein